MSASTGYYLEDEEKSIARLEDARDVYAIEAAPDRVIVKRFGRLGPFLSRLFASGIEARGVERVPENQRESKNAWNNILMWWSVNTVFDIIPIGVLAQSTFTLSFGNAVATILCFGALGAVATAFVATLGPMTGLRTMVITRFSSGYLGCTIYSVLNILTQLGFATTTVILGGQTLSNINPGTLPSVVGIIIIGVCSLIPCVVGYNMVHFYERYAWIITLISMLFLCGLGGKAGYNINAQKPLQEEMGHALTADILSFGGIVFGLFTGWAPIAADFNCRLPADTSPMRVFLLTFFGLFIPICFVTILGAALMTITDPAYVAAFGSGSTGGLVAQVLSPLGHFGQFILVLLLLSVIANNIPNTYSAGLSMQALGRPFAIIPRFFWVLLAFMAYTVAGVAGREHFSTILSNFLRILSDWTAFFIVIVAEEHFIFRRKNGPLGGYNLDDYDTPSKLPVGVAGILAGCFGAAGAVIGMSQELYTGPLGEMVGAEIGFEVCIIFGCLDIDSLTRFKLAAVFSAVTYFPLRALEIRLTGR
ncbi:permease for cytosine/purines, uracil, thiamine, allantoin-domain-containing protein [Suillus fuscotomentosus]|uniref:Permease for cytosine/purines, uracil, thiamine, allantoin-domain-containing protein n=1 Tax=Suillus fuscotomentosus TaxID=1912939 RepID=A0AAD4E513_9AGAM|nr:permease for cytosine/purines, uracil, thiamine, allantoin-domain-containing protein [Suillus fuscotomentosus]KAG1899858.1 permease for cytosine/purines, uracil, thiamine, allantoin-domain-containing protein [Suillus fuscotomentosus]